MSSFVTLCLSTFLSLATPGAHSLSARLAGHQAPRAFATPHAVVTWAECASAAFPMGIGVHTQGLLLSSKHFTLLQTGQEFTE